MKKILFGICVLFFITGCSSKQEVNKANSIQMQKQDANKAWKELDTQ
ncbi:lipoprotein [Nautilia sp. PV-1]|nr:lipoprotein [Nautilia sp. PV-1]